MKNAFAVLKSLEEVGTRGMILTEIKSVLTDYSEEDILTAIHRLRQAGNNVRFREDDGTYYIAPFEITLEQKIEFLRCYHAPTATISTLH